MADLLELPKSDTKVKINCKSETEAELVIYDDIGKDGWFFEAFGVKELDRELKKDNMKNVTSLSVRINSGGGSVFEGYAIYNRLKQHSAKVTVYVDGIAASIASIIAMAGDEIVMGEASGIMIHKPWAPIAGNSAEMANMIELLDGLEEQMINVYKRKTGRDSTEIRQMLADETWMFGQDAVDAGFATRMDTDDELLQVAASTNKTWFKKKPETPAIKNTSSDKITSFKKDIKDFLARTNA